MNLTAILTVFPVAFIAIWCGVLWLLSRMSGWNELAGAYGYIGEIRGESRSFQSASIGYRSWFLVRFRSCLGVTVDSGMLIVKPWFIFGVFQPPIAIPLDDLVQRERKMLFWTYRELRALRSGHVMILITPELAQWIEASAGRAIRPAEVPEN